MQAATVSRSHGFWNMDIEYVYWDMCELIKRDTKQLFRLYIVPIYYQGKKYGIPTSNKQKNMNKLCFIETEK